MWRTFSWLVIAAGLLLAGCSSPASAKPVGDPEQGKMLFQQAVIREAPGCSTCHALVPGEVIVGPSLAGVASRTAGREAGKSAAEYLRESILAPNAYVVEGFPEGVMYQSFGEVLSDDEINNLVAFLLTLE